MIYGNVFYFDDNRNSKKPKVSRTWPIYGTDQSHMFLNLFPAWQVEELSCIKDFILDKILEKWNEVEDNFYNAIAADPSSWDTERPLHERRWDNDIFFSRSMKTWHKGWQEYLAVLPVSDWREIFAADNLSWNLLYENMRAT
jgi:hypothetical protein